MLREQFINVYNTVSQINEANVVNLIRQGKEQAVVKHLYAHLFPVIRSYVLKNTGTLDDAKDIFHDALMLFFEIVLNNTYDEKYKPYGFIYKVSVYRWVNKCKKDVKLVLQDELPDIPTEQEPIPTQGEESKLVKEVFAMLGSTCAEILHYTIYTELLMEDIMLKMGFNSVEAVRMRHMRCKQKLMKLISEKPILLKMLRHEI